MSIFCSLVTEDCNIFRSQSKVKTLESASQLPYRHTLKRFVVLLSKGAKGPVDLCSARTEVERTGLKVSSLYFAQIKKKCGLDVGENFNLPKSENARQPQCTPEKKEA